jgi:hypothetical protein
MAIIVTDPEVKARKELVDLCMYFYDHTMGKPIHRLKARFGCELKMEPRKYKLTFNFFSAGKFSFTFTEMKRVFVRDLIIAYKACDADVLLEKLQPTISKKLMKTAVERLKYFKETITDEPHKNTRMPPLKVTFDKPPNYDDLLETYEEEKPEKSPKEIQHGPLSKTVEEFRTSGLLHFVNVFLHIFGWEIVIEMMDDDDTFIRMVPRRTDNREFSEVSSTIAYTRIAKLLKEV